MSWLCMISRSRIILQQLVTPTPYPVKSIFGTLGYKGEVAAHAIDDPLGGLQEAVAEAGTGKLSCSSRNKRSSWLLLRWMGGVGS